MSRADGNAEPLKEVAQRSLLVPPPTLARDPGQLLEGGETAGAPTPSRFGHQRDKQNPLLRAFSFRVKVNTFVLFV